MFRSDSNAAIRRYRHVGAPLLAVAALVTGAGMIREGKAMEERLRATGTFDVQLSVQTADSEIEQAAGLARMTIDKRFHGDLDAVSKGEMLASGSGPDKGSAYVALERVTGSLRGRRGSFLLQHNASVKAGVPTLTVVVVPESGTGELQGLSGTMTVTVGPDRKHSYDFTYAFE